MVDGARRKGKLGLKSSPEIRPPTGYLGQYVEGSIRDRNRFSLSLSRWRSAIRLACCIPFREFLLGKKIVLIYVIILYTRNSEDKD